MEAISFVDEFGAVEDLVGHDGLEGVAWIHDAAVADPARLVDYASLVPTTATAAARCPAVAIPAAPDPLTWTPQQLLHHWAFRVGPSTPGFEVRPRRLKGKQQWLGPDLSALRSQSTTKPRPCTWKQRRDAYVFFRRAVADLLKRSQRQVDGKAHQEWQGAALHVKDGRSVLKRIGESGSFMSGTQSQDQASTALSPIHSDTSFGSNGSIGALFTWHSDLRIESPKCNSLVSDGASVEELTAVALSMDHVRQHFVNFAQQVEQWADKFALPVFAACMELCTHGDSDSRVHLHAFLSIGPDFISGSRSGPLVRVDRTDLEWFGFQPHVRHMKKSGRCNVSKMVAGGLYYVLSAKVGTIFRSGNTWPFEA